MPSKSDIIEERKANLPLPEQPPVASDFNSADARTVNVGSGAHGTKEAKEPMVGNDLSSTGRQGVEGLSGVPNDVVTRDQKDNKATSQTTGKDYGYPEKNDPARGPN